MRPKKFSQYIQRLLKVLQLTWGHLYQNAMTAIRQSESSYFQDQGSTITLQYPHEKLPVPDRGRYKLHNEIEDCIVCDKCAKICPVD